MALMHHYSTVTADTMGHADDMRRLWRHDIPRAGYGHPFVTHGILALAALHRAALLAGPSPERETFITIAAYHQSMGLEGFRPKLDKVSEDNWRPVFAFTATMLAYVTLLPVRSEAQVAAGVGALVELFRFNAGIRSFLSPRLKVLNDTEFSPFISRLFILSPGEEVMKDANG
jgi:hypothetical protein